VDEERYTIANGQWSLAVPATFIVDRGGVIKGRHFEHDLRSRRARYILDVLDALPAESAAATHARVAM
jgi:hypothetical protein